MICGQRSHVNVIGAVKEHEYENTTAIAFPVIQCQCGHVYLFPRPSISELGRIYPPTYYAFGDDSEEPDSWVLRAVARGRVKALETRLVPFLPQVAGRPLRILDIGCGEGKFLDAIKTLIPEAQTYGLDSSSSALSRAERKGHKIIHGFIGEVEIEPQFFDAVICLHVIEHVARPDQFLNECRNLLQPAGVMLFETPTIDTLAFRVFRSGVWGGYHAPRHWHLFSASSFARLAGKAGLDVKHNETYPIGTFWVWTFHVLAMKWLPRSIADTIFPPKVIVGRRFYDFALLAATSILDSLIKLSSKAAGGMWIIMTHRSAPPQ
ncbi:class I SAM-dependent methyltransferase [Ferrovibrio terrae]|uniref:class I SAM-dependent methyltransferase n=1 Tax=Ferrovibrio terrae TaxID=2594003 RepID=UPI00163D6C08|nr:class I SAM-dependent methyltransferase [Ferrovibrio terrae]